MCIIHDNTLHYLFQNLMDAFAKSNMLTSLFLSRVGCLVCTCRKGNQLTQLLVETYSLTQFIYIYVDLFYDSRTLISHQRSLFDWFQKSLEDKLNRSPIQIERLAHFREIVGELKDNGNVDSGTKITLLRLLRDLDAFNYTKLRRLANLNDSSNLSSYSSSSNHMGAYNHPHHQQQRPLFFIKLVILKFDLRYCSAKEFIELLKSLDNGALRYIEICNKCKITPRDVDHLTVRNFMGQVEVTIETSNEKLLRRAEQSLKRLADSIHYRLVKQMPSAEMPHQKEQKKQEEEDILLQSPLDSSIDSSSVNTTTSMTNNDDTVSSLSFNTSTDLTTTTTSNNDTTTTSEQNTTSEANTTSATETSATTENTTQSESGLDKKKKLNNERRRKWSKNKKDAASKKDQSTEQTNTSSNDTLNESGMSKSMNESNSSDTIASSGDDEKKKSNKKRSSRRRGGNRKEKNNLDDSLNFSPNASLSSVDSPLTSSPVSSSSLSSNGGSLFKAKKQHQPKKKTETEKKPTSEEKTNKPKKTKPVVVKDDNNNKKVSKKSSSSSKKQSSSKTTEVPKTTIVA